MKNDPVVTALEALDGPDADLAKALASKFPLVAAKAARIAGDSDRRELSPAIAAVFRKLLKGPASADKGCSAKLAMARALIRLEHDEADLFLAGMKCVQMEGSWGGSEDVAAELRAVCAMGLVGSNGGDRLRSLVTLMADPQWPARAGALRALGALGGDSAALLLRLKALTGDPEPDVLSDCFAALLVAEGADAVPLISSLAADHESALLALGESRLPAAVGALIEIYGRTIHPPRRSTILLALTTSRTEPAIGFLVGEVGEASERTATAAIQALAIHRADPKVRQAVRAALDERGDRALEAAFSAAFGTA